MVVPVMPRVNTIGIRFTRGTKSPSILAKILHDKLGIPPEEIRGLGDYGNKRQLVKVISTQMFDHLVNRYVGYPIRIDNEHEIEVDDVSSYKDRVKITRLPFEMPLEVLKSLLERYGQVDRVIQSTSRDKEFKNVPIDEGIAIMVVNDHIPSSLWIAETQQYMFFQYDKQPHTCHNCGSLDHKANQCNVFRNARSKDRPNAVSLDLEEDQPEGTVADAASDVEDAQSDVADAASDVASEEDNVPNESTETEYEGSISSSRDDHETESSHEDTEVNQVSIFECTKCEYKCNTGHELGDHNMAIHVKTWADRAKSPPRVYNRGAGIRAPQPISYRSQ